ncbi:hypothetical protein Goshw_014553 [Gossypium schwendimanii]|uniref:Uncharacterized protein n=1 Tax=Gossypium schwendimanii TaxID=34291 RepID=A0A7J9LMX2_GOSSC|nr:hypothetical protein [Gossypium schwendimanii]
MKTISKLASSSSAPQVKYVSGSGNTYDVITLLDMFTNNGDNTPINPLVALKPYPKDYTSPKFMKFNEKTSDARDHVDKIVETLRVAELDDNLMLK